MSRVFKEFLQNSKKLDSTEKCAKRYEYTVYRRKSMPLICEKILIFARRKMQSKSSESCHIVSVKLVRNRAPDNSSYSKARKNGNPQACG